MDKLYAWYAGENGEFFPYGPHETRDDAIADAKANGVQLIHVVEASINTWTTPDAEALIENWIDDQYDIAFEDSDVEFDDPKKEAQAELQDLLNTWANKHADKCSGLRSFGSTRNEEVIQIKHKEQVDG